MRRQKTSKMPTTTKWVDRATKDDNGQMFVRCRLVARDFKPKRKGPRDDLFAAMQPLEAKKALFAFFAGVRERRRVQGHDEVMLMFVDVKKGTSQRVVRRGRVGRATGRIQKNWRYAKLKRWLYGMRKAASGWEDDYARRLVEDVFRPGRAAPTIFNHPKTQVRVVVHGDDFTFASTESELKRIQAKMHEWSEVKVHGVLGSGKRDVHEIEILGSILTWTQEGLEYEVKGGQQCNRETRGDRSRRGHGGVGPLKNKKVQKCGGDDELHELGLVGRAMRCQGGEHEDGESHSRKLEEAEKGRMGAWQNNEEVNVDVHVDSNWPVGLAEPIFVYARMCGFPGVCPVSAGSPSRLGSFGATPSSVAVLSACRYLSVASET